MTTVRNASMVARVKSNLIISHVPNFPFSVTDTYGQGLPIKEIASYATEHQIHFYEAVPLDRETVHNFHPIQGPHGRNTPAV